MHRRAIERQEGRPATQGRWVITWVKCLLFVSLSLAAATVAHADDFALPDPGLTPGEADPKAPPEVFCSRPTKERRPRLTKVCDQVFDAYNIPKTPIARYSYQCDHLIPLSIGGASTKGNLWPQPNVEAEVKDMCDAQIQALVCHGKVPLAEAHAAFAADWPSACAKYLGR